MTNAAAIRINAAVCYEFGQPLTVEPLQLDPPAAGEVRVTLKACGICHSDIAAIRGHWAGGTAPYVAGHEGAGVVESVGEGVEEFSVGDRVGVTLVRSCGQCVACQAGHTVACNGEHALARQTRLRSMHGEPVAQGLLVGAFAQACVVDQSQLVHLPDDVPYVNAALLGCAVITGFCSVTRVAAMPPNARVVVIGVGGVGLNALQAAVIQDAAQVIAVDVHEHKLQAAVTLGASDTLNASQVPDLPAAVNALCAPHGADYVYVATGRSQSFSQALAMCNNYGTVVILGMPPDKDRMFSIDAHTLTTGRRLLGSKLGDTCIREDIPQLIELYRAGKLKLDELVSATYPLAQINEAIQAVERGEALRNVIEL